MHEKKKEKKIVRTQIETLVRGWWRIMKFIEGGVKRNSIPSANNDIVELTLIFIKKKKKKNARVED